MKIEKQYLEDHQVKLTVEVEGQQLESAKHKAALKIAQRIKIPGFRPGKAPYPVILRTVGEAAILDEAMEILVNDIYPQMIDESGIKPYGPGNLENIEKLDPPTLIFTVPLEATVTLGNYQSLRFPYELKAVTDEDVAHTIEDLQERMATLEPANRAAAVGDEVSIRISAERKHVEEGQSLTLIRDHSTAVTVKPADSDPAREWPFPGFSQNLLGLNPGDERSIDYTYPEDAAAESLRGKEAIFRFKVEEVKIRHLPELNDEFAQSVGEYETLDALRTQVRSNLEQQAKSEYESSYNDQILDAMVQDAKIEFPPQMLEHEIDNVTSQLESRLRQQNLDMETYLKTRQITKDELRKEMQPTAESRIRRSLVIFEAGKLEKIQVDEKELQNETSRTLDSMQRVYQPKDLRKMVNDSFVQNMVNSIAADMLASQTLERLRSYAKGEQASAPTEAAAPTTKPQGKSKKKPKKAEAPVATPDTQEPQAAELAPSPEGAAEPKPKRKKKVVPATTE